MEINYRVPKQIVDVIMGDGRKKAEMPKLKMILSSIFAGMFVAFGAVGSNAAIHAIENAGAAKALAGVIFPVGLMLILMVGGELFTGNCLMVMGKLKYKYSFYHMGKRLALVFLGNFLGAFFIALMICYSGQFDLSGGMLGAYTIKVAYSKATIPFSNALISGILCNILVCCAVIMAAGAMDVVGKLMACFFPIMVFVIAGFEHCVANMYYIPAGIMAMKNQQYLDKAVELYGLTAKQLESLNWGNFLFHNLVPVTIGNMIGGILLVGVPLYLMHESFPGKGSTIHFIKEEKKISKSS